MDKKGLYKKAAKTMLNLYGKVKEHEKRAHATQIIFKQVEMGYGEIPRSYEELQEKVASLLNQDLTVIEKALELSGGNLDLGELSSADYSNPNSATEQFQASLLN